MFVGDRYIDNRYLSMIPLLQAIYKLLCGQGATIGERWRNAAYPSADWGPALHHHRKEWLQFRLCMLC